MSVPSYTAYLIIAGVVLMSFLAPVFVGWDAWFVPLTILPFAAVYAAFDRKLRLREERGELSP